jgi:chromosome segregation ATPase
VPEAEDSDEHQKQNDRRRRMRRLDYWKAKLTAARTEERQRRKELNQMARAFERALEQVDEIQKRINDEKAKLARPK